MTHDIDAGEAAAREFIESITFYPAALVDLLNRLDGWATSDSRYEAAEEMVDVARRELRAALPIQKGA